MKPALQGPLPVAASCLQVQMWTAGSHGSSEIMQLETSAVELWGVCSRLSHAEDSAGNHQ